MFPRAVGVWLIIAVENRLLHRTTNPCSSPQTVTKAPKLHYATACMELDLHIIFHNVNIHNNPPPNCFVS